MTRIKEWLAPKGQRARSLYREKREIFNLSIFITVAVIVGLLFLFAGNKTEKQQEIVDETTSTPVPTIANDDLPPFHVDEGEISFTKWLKEADRQLLEEGKQGMWLAQARMNEFESIDDARKGVEWQVNREAEGRNYLRYVSDPKGIWVTNTGPTAEGYTTQNIFLPEGYPYLAWDPDNPYLPREIEEGINDAAVKPDCYNPVRVRIRHDVAPKPTLEPDEPVEPEPCPEPKQARHSGPDQTLHWKDNVSTIPPSEKAEEPSPEVVSSEPEKTKTSQDSNRDTDKAVPGGKSGEDTGSVTNPDGSVTPSPPPSSPPDTSNDEEHSGDPGGW